MTKKVSQIDSLPTGGYKSFYACRQIINPTAAIEKSALRIYHQPREIFQMCKFGFRFLANILLLSFLGLFTGCATMNDVVRVKESGSEGTTQVYPVTFDQAWEISKAVFRWEGSDAIEEHKDQGYMLTSSGVNMFSWGTVMGAWIEPVDKDNTKVTVVTKRRVTVNVATTLTEGTYQKRFAQAVDIVNKGEPLPRDAPN